MVKSGRKTQSPKGLFCQPQANQAPEHVCCCKVTAFDTLLISHSLNFIRTEWCVILKVIQVLVVSVRQGGEGSSNVNFPRCGGLIVFCRTLFSLSSAQLYSLRTGRYWLVFTVGHFSPFISA